MADEYVIGGGIMAAIGAVITWLTKRNIKALDDKIEDHQKRLEAHDRQHVDCSLDLSAFKLHVSEHYPTKNDLNAARMETKESVERVHKRLDDMSSDIKTLLTRVK